MNIYTEDKALAELLKFGKTNDKRYRKLPKEAINGFLKAVAILKQSDKIEDLYRYNSLHYKVLQGNYKGYESVRCNRTWRLIFKSHSTEGGTIVTEVQLIEISHHYE
jgi:proteic killer suppression protein